MVLLEAAGFGGALGAVKLLDTRLRPYFTNLANAELRAATPTTVDRAQRQRADEERARELEERRLLSQVQRSRQQTANLQRGLLLHPIEESISGEAIARTDSALPENLESILEETEAEVTEAADSDDDDGANFSSGGNAGSVGSIDDGAQTHEETASSGSGDLMVPNLILSDNWPLSDDKEMETQSPATMQQVQHRPRLLVTAPTERNINLHINININVNRQKHFHAKF